MVTRNVQKCAISRFWWDKGKTGPSFHRRDLKIENQMSWNREVHSILDLVTKENVNVYYLHNHVSRWLHILLCRKNVSVQLLLTVVSYSNRSVSFKWELPIMPLSCHRKKRGCRERMGASWQLSFEWKILIWIGRQCSDFNTILFWPIAYVASCSMFGLMVVEATAQPQSKQRRCIFMIKKKRCNRNFSFLSIHRCSST